MPSKKSFDIKISPRTLIVYLLAAIAIALIIYYIPNYSFLEKITAQDTAFLLKIIGVDVQSKIVENKVFLNDIRIVKDCTGIQVFAVFLGLILPLPNASWKKRLFTLAILFSILYITNVLRIVLEFWLIYFNVLPWILVHYPLSFLLGIFGVFTLVLVADRSLPEFGKLLLYITQRLWCK